MRVGQGFDAHALVAGRPLVLGGIEIPHPRGLAGHSDGDVLLHAVGSALLGAAGLGDLGRHFPSTDESLAGISSGELLERIRQRIDPRFRLGNLDATVVAEEPRLGPHREKMELELARLLAVDVDRVNVKMTSTDGLGTVGRGEGIAAFAVVLLEEVSEGS